MRPVACLSTALAAVARQLAAPAEQHLGRPELTRSTTTTLARKRADDATVADVTT